MLLSLSVSNFLVFKSRVTLSFLAEGKAGRFSSNASPVGDYQVLKAVCLYGPNNVGKSCLIKAFDFLQDALEGKNLADVANVFRADEPTELTVEFLSQEEAYRFAFSYESSSHRFLSEELSHLSTKGSSEVLYRRDFLHGIYAAKTPEETARLRSSSNKLLYPFSAKAKTSSPALKAKRILTALSHSLEIVASSDLTLAKTAEKMAKDPLMRDKIVAFLKAADVDIQGFRYAPLDASHLATTTRGRSLSSEKYDSLGTKKLEALSSSIISALQDGTTLIVDELDSSLHYKLTRAIVALFNNLANVKGQLLFSTQDITLLDTKTLFRPDQIWFFAKGERGPKLYPLSRVLGSDGGSEDAIERYLHGEFGALPSPQLIGTLLSIATERSDAKRK